MASWMLPPPPLARTLQAAWLKSHMAASLIVIKEAVQVGRGGGRTMRVYIGGAAGSQVDQETGD